MIVQKREQKEFIRNIWALKGNFLHGQIRRAQATAFLLDIKHHDYILDVGCGEGFVESYLLEASFIVGTDLSKSSLLLAKQKVKRSNVDFICADATALPIKRCAFDKIAILEVIEHLPKQEYKHLRNEINNILKAGGTLLVSVPYNEQITYTQCIHCGKLTPLWGHLYSFNENNISRILSNQYSLVAICHLPNIALVSLSKIFQSLPFRIWLFLNNALGVIRQGYWILLKYEKIESKNLFLENCAS